MGSDNKVFFFLLAVPAAGMAAQTCAVCRPPRVSSLLQVARHDRDWSAGLVVPEEVGVVDVAIQAQTSDIDFAGTETGANISFKIGGHWTEPVEFVKMVPIGGLVNLSLRLNDWPSTIRLTALGDDAWSIESVLMSTSEYNISILNKTDGDYQKRLGSIHWVDQDDSPREYNIPQYRSAASPPLGMPNISNATDKTNLTNSTNITRLTNSTDVANHTITINTTSIISSTDGAQATPGMANCTTHFDERVHSMIYGTAPPGTPCIFGLDPRDEGSHCIYEDGKYGSLGWCYTDENKQVWGACGESCPLYGQELILSRKVETLLKELKEQGNAIRNLLVMPTPTNTTTKKTQVSVATHSLGVLPPSPNTTLEPRSTPTIHRGPSTTDFMPKASATAPPLRMSNLSNATEKQNLSNSTDMTHVTNSVHVANHTISTNTAKIMNSTGGATATTGIVNCTTRFDERVHSMIHVTSPPGTPCVFGLDPRDEGAHCILDDGQYGSLGWCYTDENKQGWGACGESCPLFGQAKILDKKLAQVLQELGAETNVIKMVLAPTNAAGKTMPIVNNSFDATLIALNVSETILSPIGDHGDNSSAPTNALDKTTR